MNYGEIKKNDIANGLGVRTTIFVSGCTHHCKGCFQPQTWSFDFGKPYTKEVEDDIIASLSPYYIAGLTLLGGEPMEPCNQASLLPLLRRVRAKCPLKIYGAIRDIHTRSFREKCRLARDASTPTKCFRS